MNRSGIFLSISFFLFFIFQVLLFKKLILFNTAFCFIYIGFILLMPVETNPLLLMLIGFALGLLVDMFYDHQGMHAAATVAVAFVRNYWLTAITPQGGYDIGSIPSLRASGFVWFLTYSTPLLIIHHVILFLIDAGGFGLVGITIIKSLSSVLFTMLVLLIHQFLFSQKTR